LGIRFKFPSNRPTIICAGHLHKILAKILAVAYPGIFFRWVTPEIFLGGSANLVKDRGQKEQGTEGISPLVRGSTQFANE
jgi:hypothetical protein